ncbi:endonuclease/exonuclease/phosphatase family protein [Dongia sp.]|uniref:endonuclease/exonuclease/phosphatase family protein n=1 Tax=Dongia sp. TaxID=1977262 RepID=UPI003752AFF6
MLLLRFCLLGGIVTSFLPLLHRLHPLFAAFDAFALQCVAANTVLVVVLLVFRRRLRSWRGWALAGLIAAGWSAYTVWPELTYRPPAVAEGPVLRVTNINIWWDREDLDAVIDYVSTESPDIVGLVEVTPKYKPMLAPLKALYPYSVDCVDLDPVCQTVLLSKLPLHRTYAGPVGTAVTYLSEGEIVWQGRTIMVTVTHLTVPSHLPYRPPGQPEPPMLPGTADVWQSQQAAGLAQHLAAPEPVHRIVLGDFNSVPWNPLQRAFRAATGLENRGHWAPDWPAWQPVFARIPIDPVFTRGALAIRHLKTGPNVGSDHLPVEAEIGLKQE